MSTTRPERATAHPDRAPAEQNFGWALGVLLRAYQRAVGGVLGDCPHGPRGYHVLAAVVHGDQPSQLALATHLGIDRTVMTYLIDDLVDAGLVERRLNPSDRRQRKVVATAHGTAHLEDLQRRVAEAEDELLSALRPAERDALRALLRRVACDLHGTDPADPCEVAAEVLPGGATPVR